MAKCKRDCNTVEIKYEALWTNKKYKQNRSWENNTRGWWIKKSKYMTK